MPEWPKTGKSEEQVEEQAREAALLHSDGFAPGFAG